MSLTAALSSAKSGLASTQKQMTGTSDNIANALTPGYVAREARLSSLIANGAGLGVRADIARGPTNSLLLRDIRYQASFLAGLDYKSSALGAIAQATGDPSEERSIAALFSKFEASFQTLFDSPESPAAQRAVLDAAKALTSGFHDAEEAIRAGREAADKAIATGVSVANDALQKIDALNDKIMEQQAAGGDVANLLDERDREIDRLAEQIGIRTFTRESGEIVITTKEGITLLDRDARQLAFTPVGAAPPGVTLGFGLSGLTVDGADITPTGGGAQASLTGRIAGAFQIRDADLVGYQVQLDELARRTIDLFQTADASVLAAGPPATGLFTDAGLYHDPLAPADPLPGLAGRIEVNVLADPAAGGELRRLRDGLQAPLGPTGDTAQIQAFLDGLSAQQTFSATPGLSTASTLVGYATEITSGQLLDNANIKTEAQSTSLLFQTLENRRISENGVNVDEESERLLELEQAYAANAQVISTVARMFDDLLANLG
ncbi:flagellar hook-associated protein FlgK [Hyphococcus sp.]|jgi:flagellar hook-associated protein 1 FlgK|uniref:flagellar hook-associated protein FlgK n=1 Tax=Hyphococcus sp. TaxID=2038636 RepID=UPI003D0F5754